MAIRAFPQIVNKYLLDHVPDIYIGNIVISAPVVLISYTDTSY